MAKNLLNYLSKGLTVATFGAGLVLSSYGLAQTERPDPTIYMPQIMGGEIREGRIQTAILSNLSVALIKDFDVDMDNRYDFRLVFLPVESGTNLSTRLPQYIYDDVPGVCLADLDNDPNTFESRRDCITGLVYVEPLPQQPLQPSPAPENPDSEGV